MTQDYYSTKRVTAWREDRYDEKTGRQIPGMALRYQDGYTSWCNLDVFERDYRPIKQMTFGHALAAMNSGEKVARAGWNGKGMWICLGEGNPANPAKNFWNKHTRAFAEENGGSAPVLPYFIMKTAGGEILMGWLASQSDLVAEDWRILS